jgi:hypothetical protein
MIGAFSLGCPLCIADLRCLFGRKYVYHAGFDASGVSLVSPQAVGSTPFGLSKAEGRDDVIPAKAGIQGEKR